MTPHPDAAWARPTQPRFIPYAPQAAPYTPPAAPPPGWGPVPSPPSGYHPFPVPPPRRRRARKPVLIGMAAAAATALLGVTLAVTTHSSGSGGQAHDAGSAAATPSPTPAPPPPPASAQAVSVEQLPTLLLAPADLNAVMGSPGLVITHQLSDTLIPDPADTISNPDCVATQDPDLDSTYHGSGYLGTNGQRLTEPGDNWNHLVEQFVVSFPNPAAAQAFVAKSTQTWTRCAGTTLSHHYGKDNHDESFTIGQPTATNTSVAVVNYAEGGNGWACSRDLAAKANIVADVETCSLQASDQAVTIANKILGQVKA